ncbi:FTR1 family protein [Streptomyces sp. HNM0645]|uniref:iron uptake transporter permease EfeU n=1 Tax=Streptomyces sp. HNM0645 TaxID=2782343 RepID=UPI0024B7BC1E|nr:iron uptake transporter permease EfeU [Streptomyces sp. HNM0645]MDI9888024.1 FTR1 family protein [Streptomyces sp. HNM0645]
MFGNYLIGLREGLEAGLVVCILVAYLVKTDRRDALKPVWAGVGVACGVSLAFGAALEFGSQELTFEAQELLGGTLSIVAVCLVTWMVFWMRRTARHLRAELHGRLDAALRMGTGALVATAFLAVGREGLETALFVWASVRAAADTAGSSAPLAGVLLGIATAVLLSWLFYRGALRINLAKFFAWTGGMLVVVAAGVLAYGVHDLQEARFLGGLADKAFDVSATVPPDSWYGTLLKGVFNFQPNPTVLQVTVWALYLVPALTLFLAPVGFGRSVRGGEEQKATDEQAGSGGDGARGGDGAVADGERVRDGARRAGGRTVGDER